MFPLDVQGSISFKTDTSTNPSTVKAVVERIAGMLDEAAATTVCVEKNSVRFTAGFFRITWSWNILEPYNSGCIDVVPTDQSLVVRYRLSFLKVLLTLTIVFTALLALFGWGMPDIVAEILAALPWFAAAWLCFFGANYLSAMIRFPRWLRKGLRDLPELQKNSVIPGRES